MGNILVVGSLNMDLVIQSERIPDEGETLMGDSFARFPGGKGANQAVAAARVGARVSMIGAVGDDSFGEELVEGLSMDGIAVRGVSRLPDVPTGVACILLDRAGQNRIVVIPGANHALGCERLVDARKASERADVVLVQLEVAMDVVQESVALASSVGVPVILNPAPAQALSQELLRKVHILTPNEIEAGQLTGCAVEGLDDAKRAARALLDMGVGAVVMTMGPRGALVAEGRAGSDVTLVSGYPVQAVDTVGAGDAFNGALAARLADGASLTSAARYANAVAAIAVTRRGAQPSMPTAAEVAVFLGTAGQLP